jgi:hypothetical protein
MVFSQQFWNWQTGFKIFPFNFDCWLFSTPKGWSVSFGFFLKFTVDTPGGPPSSYSVSSVLPLSYENAERLRRASRFLIHNPWIAPSSNFGC